MPSLILQAGNSNSTTGVRPNRKLKKRAGHIKFFLLFSFLSLLFFPCFFTLKVSVPGGLLDTKAGSSHIDILSRCFLGPFSIFPCLLTREVSVPRCLLYTKAGDSHVDILAGCFFSSFRFFPGLFALKVCIPRCVFNSQTRGRHIHLRSLFFGPTSLVLASLVLSVHALCIFLRKISNAFCLVLIHTSLCLTFTFFTLLLLILLSHGEIKRRNTLEGLILPLLWLPLPDVLFGGLEVILGVVLAIVHLDSS
mmetsp:Transcript_10770/g.17212  ORF Transcript_10770/g.17212 Transcript_10770/m.17212 type:complete len:251 (+) Transcript_10770:137-889(+)